MEVLWEILSIVCVHGFMWLADRDMSRCVKIAKGIQVVRLEPRELTIANLIISNILIVNSVQATHFWAQLLEGHLFLDLLTIELVS